MRGLRPGVAAVALLLIPLTACSDPDPCGPGASTVSTACSKPGDLQPNQKYGVYDVLGMPLARARRIVDHLGYDIKVKPAAHLTRSDLRRIQRAQAEHKKPGTVVSIGVCADECTEADDTATVVVLP